MRNARLRAGVGIAPCLVPSSGFYEWKAPNGGAKQPYRIYRGRRPAFAMAGLWDVWEGEDETISCVTILTTEPNDLMNSIHDRMPVVLPHRTLSPTGSLQIRTPARNCASRIRRTI